MSSFWWNFHHWLHWKLSFWQLSVQPVMKISSKWRHFRFSVYRQWDDRLLQASTSENTLYSLKHAHGFALMRSGGMVCRIRPYSSRLVRWYGGTMPEKLGILVTSVATKPQPQDTNLVHIYRVNCMYDAYSKSCVWKQFEMVITPR